MPVRAATNCESRVRSASLTFAPGARPRARMREASPFAACAAGWSAAATEVRAQAETDPDVTPVDEPDGFGWSLSVYALCAKVN